MRKGTTTQLAAALTMALTIALTTACSEGTSSDTTNASSGARGSQQGPGPGGSGSSDSSDTDDADTSDSEPSGADSSVTVAALDMPVFDPHWGTVGVFTEGATCRSCHRATAPGASPTVLRHPDANGRDVSPDGGWPASMMALAFHDPYFRAVVADEVDQFPHLAGDIEDKCLTCHAPMGRTRAHRTGVGLSGEECLLNPDGCYRMATAREAMHAREGVSCALCHQITDDGHLGSNDSFSGGYELVDNPGAKKGFGKYPDPATHAMTNFSGHQPVAADYMGESAVCATCHNLYTQTLTLAGEPTGDRFLEQGPHLEWRNSRFAGETSCQDCHMRVPEAGYSSQLATSPTGRRRGRLSERPGVHSHEFLGGNTHMLKVMKTFAPEVGLGDTVPAAAFERKVRRTRAFLGEAAAELAVVNLARSGDQLALDLAVRNLTGHKLPTSFPSRRVWVHLTVTDGDGQVVFESGAVDGEGRLAVNAEPLAADCLAVDKPDGFTNAGCYSPHRNTITEPGEAAVYEAVLGDVNGDITHVLLHADRYLKDNRIPPQGFTEGGEAFMPETATAGAARDDADFNRDAGGEGSGTDVVHYRVAVPRAASGLTVRAELLYQSVRPSFVDGLHSDADEVTAFKAMYEAVPPTVETLATLETAL